MNQPVPAADKCPFDDMPAGAEMDALVAWLVMGWRHAPGWMPSQASQATWELIDKIEHTGFGVQITGPYASTRWLVNIGKGAAIATAGADTIPLAICRAVLKAVASAR